MPGGKKNTANIVLTKPSAPPFLSTLHRRLGAPHHRAATFPNKVHIGELDTKDKLRNGLLRSPERHVPHPHLAVGTQKHYSSNDAPQFHFFFPFFF